MAQTPSPARSDLKELVERLGGHLDACLIDENSQTLAHGPVTIASNCVSGVYEIPVETVGHSYYYVRTAAR